MSRSFTWRSGDIRIDFSVKEAQEHKLFDAEGLIDTDTVRELAVLKMRSCDIMDAHITVPYCVTTSQPRESFKVKDRTEIDLILKKIKVIRELIQLGSTPVLQANLKKLKDRYEELAKA
jgi:hypothetical protein